MVVRYRPQRLYRVGMFEGFDEFFEEVFARFAQAESWRLFPETLDVLKALKACRGYELGIISNFDSRLFSVLRGLGSRTSSIR